MQVGIGQYRQDFWRIGQARPVELDVLPGGEVAVALVIGAGHIGQLAQLHCAQGAIGDGHAQHVAVQLQVQAVHQPVHLERLFVQLAAQAAGNLLLELAGAVLEKLTLERVVSVHPRLPRRHRQQRALALAT
ncbi:hypothetical protein D3C79_955300 [compost metagenome]